MTSTTKAQGNATASSGSARSKVAELVASDAVTIEVIDVATAQLDPNVRADATYTPEFAESIKTDGVREPVYARRDADGVVYVWDGQRRTLAAKEAGTPTMLGIFGLTPATVKDSQRILDQLRTFNRDELTLADRITAYEQLALDGISDAAIGRAAGQPRDQVKQTVTVARSASAKRAAQDHGQLTLDKLLLIAEFEDDQDAIDRIAHSRDDDLPYLAQEIRDDRAIRDATRNLVEKYATTGAQVFTEWGGFRHVDRLTDAADDAEVRPSISPESHTECVGRAVYLTVWGPGDNDYRAEDVCSRPDLHHDKWATPGNTLNAAAPVNETNEQREAREEAETATRKAERARVLRNNKAWRTATTVRRDWVTTLLSRKTLPREHTAFVALSLTEHPQTITEYKAGDLLSALLGQDDSYQPRSAAAALVKATPAKAGHVTLAVVLSAREARAEDVDGWRHVSPVVTGYLIQLEAWGYKLSPVERIAAGYPEVDHTEDQTSAAASDQEADSE